jgi:hypothetical protein
MQGLQGGQEAVTWRELIGLCLLNYSVVLLLTGAGILEQARAYVESLTPWLAYYTEMGEKTHFVRCRMCVGFWTSLGIVYVVGGTTIDFGWIYGLSYFLATQER